MKGISGVGIGKRMKKVIETVEAERKRVGRKKLRKVACYTTLDHPSGNSKSSLSRKKHEKRETRGMCACVRKVIA
jgi:hypothetical protein